MLVWIACAGCGAGFASTPRPDAASAETTVPPSSFGAVHAIAGEAMEYEVRLRQIIVGRVQVVVGQPGEVGGRRAVILRSRGGSDGVVALLGELSWEMSTTVDLDSGSALVEDEEFTARVAGQSKHEKTHRNWEHAATHHNIHSATGALRGWRSQIGATVNAEVYFGMHSIDVELHDVGREVIGTTPAVRYEGVAEEKFKVSIWISDDVARVPLRVHSDTKFGAIDVDLVSYEAPGD